MEAYQRFHKVVFQWERNLLDFVGFDFISDRFEPNSRTYFVVSLALVTFIDICYTLIYYDYVTKLTCAILLVLFIQVTYDDFHF